MKEHILLTAKKRLEMKLPIQKFLLSPWLLEGSLNMIYAWRGVGKTHVALEIACAVASGGRFLNWRVEDPKGVIYIDGEMPPNFFNQRLEIFLIIRNYILTVRYFFTIVWLVLGTNFT